LLRYSPSPARWIAAILTATFIAGAIYFLAISPDTRPRLASTLSLIRTMAGRHLFQDAPTILSDKTRGHTLDSNAHGPLLVIEGMVRGIPPLLPQQTVRATLYNAHGSAIKEAGATCGNVLSLDALETLPRDSVLNFLAGNSAALPQNYPQEGESPETAGTVGTAPFMIIFFDLPAEDTEFEVEIVK